MVKLLNQYKSDIYGNYRKKGLLYGLISGGILSVYVLIMWLVGRPMTNPEGFATEGVLAICIFYMSYRYREHLPEKRVFFKELMLLGLMIGVVAAVVYGLWLWLYGGVLDTDFCVRCIETRLTMMETQEDSFEMNQAIKAVKAYTVGDWAFIGGFRTAVMSILTAFLSSILFRTEKNIKR